MALSLRDKKFTEIKSAYSQFDRELREKFLYVVRDTAKGIWGTSSMDTVFTLFKKIHLGQKKQFLDIGCGDGRIVLIASLFTKAAGIEIDKSLINKGNEIKSKLKIKNARLICDDFFSHDIKKYDIIFINPDKGFHHGLENKLLKELNGKLIVYNNIFMPRFLKRGKTHWIDQVPITEFTRE
jgi:protein-L-isoaspartate O-methyltransferase